MAPAPEPAGARSARTSTATAAGCACITATFASSSGRCEDAFDLLGERYYLHLSGEPKVTVGRDSIIVRFPVEKDD